jgi:hypothetical protein
MTREVLGVCAICDCDATERDHNHVTGMVRGLLCRECNIALGFFRDNDALLQRAITYLSLPDTAVVYVKGSGRKDKAHTREYMREYRARPGMRSKTNARMRAWYAARRATI